MKLKLKYYSSGLTSIGILIMLMAIMDWAKVSSAFGANAPVSPGRHRFTAPSPTPSSSPSPVVKN